MSSFVAYVSANSGADRGDRFVQNMIEIDNNHSFGTNATTGTNPTAAVAHSLFTYQPAQEVQLLPFRHVHPTAISHLNYSLHLGPHMLGTVCDVVAFWAPSDVSFRTMVDVLGHVRIHRWTVGSTFTVPPSGLPIPYELDLPLWAYATTIRPRLYIAIQRHAATNSATVAAGHYLELRVEGRVHFYGGL